MHLFLLYVVVSRVVVGLVLGTLEVTVVLEGAVVVGISVLVVVILFVVAPDEPGTVLALDIQGKVSSRDRIVGGVILTSIASSRHSIR